MSDLVSMTPERWSETRRYVHEVCPNPDEQRATLADRAKAAGLPDIAVSSDVGHLLQLLVRPRQVVLRSS